MRRVRIPGAIILASVLLQSCFSLLAPLSAHAVAITDHVVINEISVGSSPKWVELYNPTDQPVNLKSWRVLWQSQDDAKKSTFGSLIKDGVVIQAHGYWVVSADNVVSDSNSAKVTLYDSSYTASDLTVGIVDMTVTYPAMTAAQSYARIYDAADSWVTSTPSEGKPNPVSLTTAPTLTKVPSPSKLTTPTLSWLAIDGAVSYTYEYAISADFSNATTGSTTTTSVTPTLTHGTYYWRVQAVPAVGDESPWSDTGSFVIDTDGPVISTSGIPATVTSGQTVTVSATDPSNGVSYQIDLLDGLGNVLGGVASSSYTIPSLQNGSYTLRVTATDGIGNQSQVSQTIKLENTLPSGTVDITLSEPTATDDATLTLSGTSTGVSTITITPVGGISVTITPNTDGTWSYPIGHLVAGTYAFTVDFYDNKGNPPFEKTVTRTVLPYVAPTSATISTDLTTQLNRPSVFTPLTTIVNNVAKTPESSDMPSSIASIAPDMPIDGSGDKANDTSGQVLAASTSGWRLFGIAWQWWAIAALVCAVGWWMLRSYRFRVAEADDL